MENSFDVVVIGGGPGGYIAAIRAAQLGLNTACIDQWRNPAGEYALGGTCLNVGCIPSKALLASSEEYEKLTRHAADHGIMVESIKIDLAKMQARKQSVVAKMTKGIEFLFRKNKVTWFTGHGKLIGHDGAVVRVEVNGSGAAQVLQARNVVIATGSKSRPFPGVRIDNKQVCDNEGALAFEQVPKRLAIIGAGVIGLELGSVWRRLGAEVTVLEALPSFLGAVDQAVAKEALRQFTKQGLDIRLAVKVEAIKPAADAVTVSFTDAAGKAQDLACDRLIVAIGRVPNTDDLGLASCGLSADSRGYVEVDQHCQTSVAGIYAIGDVVRGAMLAHKAEDEGVMVAERIAGQQPHIDYNCIPWVIYTAPEIAWVGATEQQLIAEGRKFRAGQFPFAANGRALGINAASGFVKLIADAQTDEVLGVHIIGPNASDLIAEAVMAMEFKASAEDIGRITHAHPSLSEVLREAALASDQRALNM